MELRDALLERLAIIQCSEITGHHIYKRIASGQWLILTLAASRPLLPDDSTWVSINSGNHAQFGWYGNQFGDNPAAISRTDQQTLLIAAALPLLERLK
jgi:hypothetical protein